MIAARRPEESDVYRELKIVNPTAMVARGLHGAYIGHSAGLRPVAVYDYEECIQIIMGDLSLSYEEAVDYLSEHVVPDMVGIDMPVFVVEKTR